MDMKGNAWKLEEIKRKERTGMEIEEMHGHERKWKKRKDKQSAKVLGQECWTTLLLIPLHPFANQVSPPYLLLYPFGKITSQNH